MKNPLILLSGQLTPVTATKGIPGKGYKHFCDAYFRKISN